jgi:hypothetical protein
MDLHRLVLLLAYVHVECSTYIIRCGGGVEKFYQKLVTNEDTKAQT